MSQEHLREVTCGLQQDGKLHKRWFNCQSADLFAWHHEKKLVRFEFCYNKHRDEHSLRWEHGVGFSHARIDDGEDYASKKSSPILVADDHINSDYIYKQFKKLSNKIDIDIRLFIMRKLLGIVVEY